MNTKVTMPCERSVTQFKNYYKSIRKPFILLSDFESVLVKEPGKVNHKAASYVIIIDMEPGHQDMWNNVNGDWDRKTVYTYEYNNNDDNITPDEYQKKTLRSFYNNLSNIMNSINMFVDHAHRLFKNPKAMKMTAKEKDEHKQATHCCYCSKKLTMNKKTGDETTRCVKGKGDEKVRDHCHLTGNYRGASCSTCNINITSNVIYRDVPLYFHNARGYDNNHIWQMLGHSDLPLTYKETGSDGESENEEQPRCYQNKRRNDHAHMSLPGEIWTVSFWLRPSLKSKNKKTTHT